MQTAKVLEHRSLPNANPSPCFANAVLLVPHWVLILFSQKLQDPDITGYQLTLLIAWQIFNIQGHQHLNDFPVWAPMHHFWQLHTGRGDEGGVKERRSQGTQEWAPGDLAMTSDMSVLPDRVKSFT